MKITFTPIFNRKKHLNKRGLASIEVMAYEDRKRSYFSTKIFISPKQWDKRNKRINDKHPQADDLNIQIEKKISMLEHVQTENVFNGKPFTIKNIKDTIGKSLQGNSFIEFMRNSINKNMTLAKKTKTSHLNTLNKLTDFKKDRDILFSDIDYSFADDFFNYLREKKLAPNTLHKQHKNLRRYIELAIDKGFIKTDNPCKKIRITYKQKDREVLTIEEIKEIEKKDLTEYDEKIGYVRDIFLFACFTGLRISDATNLKTQYVKKEKDGFALDFITLKVGKRAQIPLHILFKSPKQKRSKPEQILEKYYDESRDYVFPKLSEAYINRNLKLIASLAGISIKVTFHTARHSFGTYMSCKIPLPQLMFLMQHSDIRTTMIYVNISKELADQGLMKVDWEY